MVDFPINIPEIYIGFPDRNTLRLGVGDTLIDYIRGTAVLTDGTTLGLSNRVSGAGAGAGDRPLKSLLSLYIDTSAPIYIEASAAGIGIQFSGTLPAGVFKFPNLTYDYLLITTTQSTDILIIASTDPRGVEGKRAMPSTIITGAKTNISTTASQLTTTATPIRKVVTVRVRSLGTGTYIALGDATSQPYRLTSVNTSHDIDWVDDLSKVYVVTDVGNTGALEWIGA